MISLRSDVVFYLFLIASKGTVKIPNIKRYRLSVIREMLDKRLFCTFDMRSNEFGQ